jgi:chitinase
MGAMISQVELDIIWVQYYNTPGCSAQDWVLANPNYASTGIEQSSGFSYNGWADFLKGTASENAKIYIGVPGAPNTDGLDWFLNQTQISSLISAYFCKKNFGGVMIWEATSSERYSDRPYYAIVKNILTKYNANETQLCTMTNTTILSIASSTAPGLSSTTILVSKYRRSAYPPYWNISYEL